MALNKRTEIRQPLARSERLLIEHIDDETVIYDEETKTAHALKPLAAAAFLYADGHRSPGDIAELASHRLGVVVTESEVAEAIEQLHSAALLDEPELGAGSALQISRRTALKSFAAAGMAASAGSLLITSVATAGTPSSANCPDSSYSSHTSCGTYGAILPGCTPCHQQSDCSSGFVCALVPCDTGSGCGQTVCVPSKTAISSGFTTLPATAKYCPAGDRYYTGQGYQYKCCSPGSEYYNSDGTCTPSQVYTSMVDGKTTTCGCSGEAQPNNMCCPSGYIVRNGVCVHN